MGKQDLKQSVFNWGKEVFRFLFLAKSFYSFFLTGEDKSRQDRNGIIIILINDFIEIQYQVNTCSYTMIKSKT